MSKMRRNRDVPHIGRALADKAAEMGPAGYDVPISRLVQTTANNSANVTIPDARTTAAKKKLGVREADLNPGYNSRNKFGGTPVREIEQHKTSFNE